MNGTTATRRSRCLAGWKSTRLWGCGYYLNFAHQSGPFLPRPHGSAGSRLTTMRVSNPLLGGAEAEGFGVGIHDREPTPALRATPPGRGFSDGQRFRCKIQVLNQSIRLVSGIAYELERDQAMRRHPAGGPKPSSGTDEWTRIDSTLLAWRPWRSWRLGL